MLPVKCAAQIFVGAWSLVNITLSQGGKSALDTTYGKHPTGAIFYSESGWMSTIITATDPELAPPNLTLPVNANQSDADWAKVGKYNLAYSGPYHINETAGMIVHGPLISASLLSYEGSYQQRFFKFNEDGNYLTLSANYGNGISDNLLYQRLPQMDTRMPPKAANDKKNMRLRH